MLDSEKIERNCKAYKNSHGKSLEVLRKADGKKDYHQIASELNLHPTIISSLLKKAEKLGLANKQKGFYKKVSGIMGYMPKTRRKKEKRDKKKEIKKFEKKVSQKKVYSNIPSIRLDINKAEKMMDAYAWLYLTENTLRDLIRKVFIGEKNWWKNRVNPSIQREARETILKDKYYSPKRTDELDYTHLGQLMEIVISKQNWKFFEPLLNEKDKNSFKVLFSRALPFRNAIGHCIPLQDEDYKTLEFKFKEILGMIK